MKSTDVVQPMAVQTAIAINGDKTIPNQIATSIDTSSIEAGFLPVTSQPLSSGGQAPERADFNGMFYLSTDQRVFLQNGGVITYSADVVSAIGGYPQNAILGYIDNSGNFGFVKSLIDDNAYNFVETPDYINGIYWELTNLLNVETLQNTVDILNNTTFITSGLGVGIGTTNLAGYLPNDGKTYFVWIQARLTSKSGSESTISVSTDLFPNARFIGTDADSGRSSAAEVLTVVPVGPGRTISFLRNNSSYNYLTMVLCGYMRV